jgi:flagellar hook assembly protein FlgD
MSASDVGAVNIEIYNILGEKVMCLQDNVSTSGKINVSLNGSALPSGVYIVKAIMKSSQTIVRWDIKR